ncbi:MAG: rhodanese-like domain-containing protein [Pseudomonadota bacterium]
MKKLLLLLSLLILPFSSIAAGGDPFGLLTVDQVSDRLGKTEVYVFDANNVTRYKEGHLPGASHVEFNKYSEKALPKNREATLIFYCYNPACTASHEAAKRAIKFGYKNVFVMSAGIEGWKNAKKPVQSGTN